MGNYYNNNDDDDYKKKKNIQSWPKILAPLVNMIKGGCEN